MKTHNKPLSLLLTAILLTAMLTFAGGDVYAGGATVNTAEKFYTVLGDSTVHTITVSGDFEINQTVIIDRQLTINGNGKITLHSSSLYVPDFGNVTLAGDVKIEGGSGMGLVRVYGAGIFTMKDRASLTADNTAIIVESELPCYVYIYGGSIHAKRGDGIQAFYKKSNVTVTGGTISGYGAALSLEDGSIGTITGGSFRSIGDDYKSAGVFLTNKSKVTISGKTYIGGRKSIFMNRSDVNIVSSPDLKITGEVKASVMNTYPVERKAFFNTLQQPLSVKAGSRNSFSIKGYDAGITYTLSNPSAALNASIADNTVTFSPQKAGEYDLKLTSVFNDSTLSLTIPVTVSANGSNAGDERPSIPETGALPVLPMLVFFGFAVFVAVGTIGYKAYAKRSR